MNPPRRSAVLHICEGRRGATVNRPGLRPWEQTPGPSRAWRRVLGMWRRWCWSSPPTAAGAWPRCRPGLPRLRRLAAARDVV